jgi:hypothetical protein
MKRLTLVVLFFMLFLISCSTGDAPFEHKYIINLLLKPGMKFQKAFIDSTYRLDVPVSYYHPGISGAEIFIVAENSDTFSYSESRTNMGLYYSNDSFCVKYGMEYFVNISVEGEDISKEVQVPGSLAIFYPEFSDTILLSNPPLLIWNSCGNSYDNTYMVTAHIMGETQDFLPMLTPDTTMGIFYNRILFEEKDTMYTVLVEAMDSNVYTYFKSWLQYGELNDDGRAIGLIGAVSFDTVAVWVKE